MCVSVFFAVVVVCVFFPCVHVVSCVSAFQIHTFSFVTHTGVCSS